MPPAGSESAQCNVEICFQLQRWSENHGGVTFDSSLLFTLPDRSKRGPDASWIAKARWEALSKEDRESFTPICPDFVIELRSRSNRLKDLQQQVVLILSSVTHLNSRHRNRNVEVKNDRTCIFDSILAIEHAQSTRAELSKETGTDRSLNANGIPFAWRIVIETPLLLSVVGEVPSTRLLTFCEGATLSKSKVATSAAGATDGASETINTNNARGFISNSQAEGQQID